MAAHILYLHQYFKTPQEGGAVRSYHLAKAMVEAGYQVTVITAHNSKQVVKKVIDGIMVIYLPIEYRQEFSFSQRVKAFVKFSISAIKAAEGIGRIDLCFVSSTPLTLGITALSLRLRRRIPYVFEVRDLWPTVPYEMGIIRSEIVYAALKQLEKLTYAESFAIVALSDQMAEGVLETYPSAKVSVIPNFADTEFFYPLDNTEKMRLKAELGLNEKRLIVYTGSMGVSNGLEHLLKVAAALPPHEFEFYLLGEGSEKPRLEALANEKGLVNVKFISLKSKEEVRQFLQIADFAWCGFADYPALNANSPNKLFDALACGCPIIVNQTGWMKNLVEQENCGLYLSHSDDNEVITSKLMASAKEAEVMCSNARTVASSKFSKSSAADQVIRVIAEAIATQTDSHKNLVPNF